MLTLTFIGASDVTVNATLQRSDTLEYFNRITSAWEAAPAFGDKSIPLNALKNENLGTYQGFLVDAALASPGLTVARFHDADRSDRTIGAGELEIRNAEQDGFTALKLDSFPLAESTVFNDQGFTIPDQIHSLVAEAGTLNEVDNDFMVGSLLAFQDGTSKGVARPIELYVIDNVSFPGQPFINVSASVPLQISVGDRFAIFGFEGSVIP